MKKISTLFLSFFALSACSDIPPEAYYNRGMPESLLDVSSETVNVSLNDQASLSKLSAMVMQDPPARAELHCSPAQAVCVDAKSLFEKSKIPAEFASAPGGGATLIYERVVARDCEQRYIDNSINPYNLNHPTFGCSLAGNLVQMVSDKRQFTSPGLLDFQDGEKAVQNYRVYASPPSTGSARSVPLLAGVGGGS